MNLLLRIITPTQNTTHEVEWLEINTPAGNRVILPHHAPLIATLTPRSLIKYQPIGAEVIERQISHGVVDVNRTRVILVTNDVISEE